MKNLTILLTAIAFLIYASISKKHPFNSLAENLKIDNENDEINNTLIFKKS